MEIEALYSIRQDLLKNNRTIKVRDLGAGSTHMRNSDRRISDIARFTASSHKFSTLYSRIIRYYNFKSVIELGTSVGINAVYLASASDEVELSTFEGSTEIAAVARSLFEENGTRNIRLIEGNIDVTLEQHVETIAQLDFALIDANHRFEPTVHYLELLTKKVHAHSIIAVDDIHSSPAMERAWRSIQNHLLVQTTVDLYRCGLVFFNPSLTRQNVVLQF
jgi:predicted O-methyltransferase YrrM